MINRDNAGRRIVVSANTTERDLGGHRGKAAKGGGGETRAAAGILRQFPVANMKLSARRRARIGLLSAVIFDR